MDTEDAIWALRDVSFDVEEGSVIGIIGRNGAGKSTLLKILSRITEPTSGRATIRGKVSSLLEVGTGFHPELTGRENVFLNGAILGMSRAEVSRKFDEIVDFSGVEKFIDTPVKRYSSGMTVRLAFSVAAHLEPEVLIIDEVLAVGDAEFQRKCLGKIEATAGFGKTVLFVSHNLASVNRLCDETIWLDKGVVVKRGPTDEITASYLSGDGPSGGTRQWQLDKAPGSDDLKLLGVTVKNSLGQIKSSFDIGEILDIEIRYAVLAPNLQFRCDVDIFTQGVLAFTTIELTESERAGPREYVSRVQIPANLLAEGEHSVTIAMFTSFGVKYRYVLEHDVIGFRITDSMDGTSARGDYAQNFAGVLRPKLEWTTRIDGDLGGIERGISN